MTGVGRYRLEESFVAGADASTANGTGEVRGKHVLHDKFILGEELGRGAYGQVFKATDKTTAEVVAIKQISLAGVAPGNLQQIMMEIELLQNLDHANIVKYLGSFKTRSHLYIILEYMDNGAISQIIKPSRFGVFSESIVAVYIAQVLQGLDYLHHQGVVHRDIKGANILTTKEGLVKLADFGVAAKLSDADVDNDQLKDDVAGTPYWMAPEVIEMTSVTAAADIWGVGCLVIEMLTGFPPYYDLQPWNAMFRIVQDSCPPLPDGISALAAHFLSLCLQKDPKDRPSAKELLGHDWLRHNRQTVRQTWRKHMAKGMTTTIGRKSNAHESVSSVIERLLQADESTSGLLADQGTSSSQQADYSMSLPAPADVMLHSEFATYNTLQLHRSSDHSANGRSNDDAAALHPSTPLSGKITIVDNSLAQPSPSDISESLTASEVPPRLASQSSVPSGICLPGDAPDSLRALLLAMNAPVSATSFRSSRLDDGVSSAVAGGDAPSVMASPLSSHASPGAGHNAGTAAAQPDNAELAQKKGRHGREFVRQLVSQLHSKASYSGVMIACEQLTDMFRQSSERQVYFVLESGIVAVIELLHGDTLRDADQQRMVLAVLELVNTMVAADPHMLQLLCLTGAVPCIVKYAEAKAGGSSAIRLQAARFLEQMCFGGAATLQMLVTCGGLTLVVHLLEEDYHNHGSLAVIAVRCLWHILEQQLPALPKVQLCRLLVLDGLVKRAVCCLASIVLQGALHSAVMTAPARMRSKQRSFLLNTSQDGASPSNTAALASRTYNPSLTSSINRIVALGARDDGNAVKSNAQTTAQDLQIRDRLAELLVEMSTADTVVKMALARPEVLRPIFDVVRHILDKTVPGSSAQLALRLLDAVKNLTMDPIILQSLQDAEAVEKLVKILETCGRDVNAAADALAGESLQLQLVSVQALYNLCFNFKERQVIAARSGLVRQLKELVGETAKAKSKATPEDAQALKTLRALSIKLLCNMVHSSDATRTQLHACQGLNLLLNLLKEEAWQMKALEALAAWLSEDLLRVEPKLEMNDSVLVFVELFQTRLQSTDYQTLDRMLQTFYKMVSVSHKFCVAIAQSSLPKIIVDMLDRDNAFVVGTLLRILQSLYEQYPRPKELLVKFNIQEKLKAFARSSRAMSAELVRAYVQKLLHAFTVNLVL